MGTLPSKREEDDDDEKNLTSSEGTEEGKKDDDDDKVAARFAEHTLVDCERLLWRLKFEEKMYRGLCAFCNFLVITILLGAGLCELIPAHKIAVAQRRLREQYRLDEVSSIADFESVYAFAATFAQTDARSRPTAPEYWCESRYFSVDWDPYLQVPKRECKSPRKTAFGVTNRPSWQSHSHDGICRDNDTALALFTGLAGDSCTDSPAANCMRADTAVFCRKTCGYCASFEYDSLNSYKEQQYALLPTVFFQTRWPTSACEGFAESLVDLDVGYGSGMVWGSVEGPSESNDTFACVKKDEVQTTSHALSSECVPCRPGSACDKTQQMCENSSDFTVTSKLEALGTTLYPEILASPAKDIQRLQHVQWLDGQTSAVTVASMAYTQDVEIYTYFGAAFEVKEGGRLESRVFMQSYRELEAYTNIVGLTLAALILSLGGFATALIGAESLKRAAPDLSKLRMLEALVYFIVVSVSFLMLLWWSVLPWMTDTFDYLLQQFIAAEDLGEAARRAGAGGRLLKEFFKASEDLAYIGMWQASTRVVGYVLMHILAVQTFFVFKVHPKASAIFDMTYIAFNDLFVGVLMFMFAFCIMGITAWCVLGPTMEHYSTVSATFATQTQWLYGEALINSQAARYLSSPKYVLYNLYAFGYVILAFWLAVTIIFAIVIDAVARVWRKKRAFVADMTTFCTAGFVEDVKLCLYSIYMPYPAHFILIEVVEEMPKTLRVSEMRERMPASIASEEAFEVFLKDYDRRCSGLDCDHRPKQPDVPAGLIKDEQEEVPAPLPIAALGDAAQKVLQDRLHALVLKGIEDLRQERPAPCWEEKATTMACEVVQEMLLCIMHIDEAEANGLPLPTGAGGYVANAFTETVRSGDTATTATGAGNAPAVAAVTGLSAAFSPLRSQGLVIQETLPKHLQKRPLQQQEDAESDYSDESV
eukprot:TRINITY_DN28966_c0_g1_i1.p1 TRINITY_DN28966_c0_g1~~TRINITY_DN28966_c0_g1_i1.p1  ORF type:complete len:932 (+),score=253.05 TRINITY_DN28966_c0_g1_i1:160-2955(+)